MNHREFLENLDGLTFLNQQGSDPSTSSVPPGTTFTPSMQHVSDFQPPLPSASQPARADPSRTIQVTEEASAASPTSTSMNVDEPNRRSDNSKPKEPPTQPILPAPTKKERFLLIAADQGMGSPNERLNRVIQAKYEAGLLKPYNYVKGYARLSKWMDRK